VVQTFSSKADEPVVREGASSDEEESPFRRAAGDRRLTTRAGMNRFRWGLTSAPLFRVPPRIVMWGGGGATGPAVVPGTYQVRLRLGAWSQTEKLEVLKDPRLSATQAELQEQFDLAVKVGGHVKEIYDSILRIRDVRKQATELGERLKKAGLGDDAEKAAKALADKLTRIEGDLTQLQGEGGQDALNYPGRLDNQFVALYSEVASSTGRPTAGAVARLEDLKPQLARLLGQLKEAFDRDLASFNQVVRSKNAPPVIVGSATATPASP
jgi:hypothetical protein